MALSLRGDEIRGVLAAKELEHEDRFEGAFVRFSFVCVWVCMCMLDAGRCTVWCAALTGSGGWGWTTDTMPAFTNMETPGCTWQPEFGSWMVESTPNRPYGAFAHDLLR